MKITYIHHSAFLVELDSVLLLFDYTEGPLPDLPQDKDLLVFASHSHGDHFSPVIFDLAETHPRILYILSDDIWENKVPESLYGYVRFMDSGALLKLSQGTGSGTTITAYRSTDQGVAFVVENGGTVIYHAGDLNHWHWNGEPDDWNHTMADDYHQELEKMRKDGVRPDAAMVPVDGRLEEWFYLGLAEFMDTVGADHVFPMHFWGDFGITRRVKEHPALKGCQEQIHEIHRQGEEFIL